MATVHLSRSPRHLSKWNKNLDRFVWHEDCISLGPFDETKFLQSFHVPADIRIIAFNCLCQSVHIASLRAPIT